jgi:hypothetical protein
MNILATFASRSANCLLLALLGLGAGCGGKGNPGGSVDSSESETPQAIQSAFKEAKPEIKAAADQIAAAIQNQEAPKAFLQLQQLSSRSDLTADQSAAAARASASVRAQLQVAAARGDKAAAELLEEYHNSK